MITTGLTGHLYYGSSYECYDDCGTCSGANCDDCVKIYEVANKIFDSLEEAKEYEELMQKAVYHEGQWFEYDSYMSCCLRMIDNVLCAPVYIEYKETYAPMNKKFVLYDELYKEHSDSASKFNECVYADKHKSCYGNDCGALKACKSDWCFMKMKKGETRYFY